MQIGLIQIGQHKSLTAYKNTFINELSAKSLNIREIETNGNSRVSGFQYLIFIIHFAGFFSKKYDQELTKFFQNSSSITARYASVYVPKAVLSARALVRYMKKMESQGLMIHESDILYHVSQVKEIARQLNPITPGS